MKKFRVKILTKLGSTQYKEVEAESEEKALRKAEARFPLHKQIDIVESSSKEIAEVSPAKEEEEEEKEDLEFKRNLATVKLQSRKKAAQRTKKEGWIIAMVGIVAQLVILVVAQGISLWLIIPIVWGAGRITYATNELKIVLKELQTIQ